MKEYQNYENMNINKKLIINLRDLGHVIRCLYEGKGSQKRILIILSEVGSITQSELTQRIGIQSGSASEVIRKLEKAHLIERTECIEDRRTTSIQLTDKGRIEAQKAVKQRELRHQEMFACLSDEEKETLLNLVEKVNHDWKNRY